mgnify:CR=1 FL=1|tara:strand:- start:111 stop:671 length:561 start_codon:yes stop_codon:yes gene_type:complete
MDNKIKFSNMHSDGPIVLDREVMEDTRGAFTRLYCKDEFSRAGLLDEFVQMNLSLSRKEGTIRGLHFQKPPYSEAKVVTCLKGEIHDVALDIRKESRDYLKFYPIVLSESNRKSLVIPKGFAHGFQTLTADCLVLYMHSNYYAPDFEDGLNALDDSLQINWPLSCSEMSDRDRNFKNLQDSKFKGI